MGHPVKRAPSQQHPLAVHPWGINPEEALPAPRLVAGRRQSGAGARTPPSVVPGWKPRCCAIATTVSPSYCPSMVSSVPLIHTHAHYNNIHNPPAPHPTNRTTKPLTAHASRIHDLTAAQPPVSGCNRTYTPSRISTCEPGCTRRLGGTHRRQPKAELLPSSLQERLAELGCASRAMLDCSRGLVGPIREGGRPAQRDDLGGSRGRSSRGNMRTSSLRRRTKAE